MHKLCSTLCWVRRCSKTIWEQTLKVFWQTSCLW